MRGSDWLRRSCLSVVESGLNREAHGASSQCLENTAFWRLSSSSLQIPPIWVEPTYACDKQIKQLRPIFLASRLPFFLSSLILIFITLLLPCVLVWWKLQATHPGCKGRLASLSRTFPPRNCSACCPITLRVSTTAAQFSLLCAAYTLHNLLIPSP